MQAHYQAVTPIPLAEIKDLLDAKVKQYNRLDFIADDPIQIPHRYSRKEDIEISGFLSSIIAWGQRKTIINNASRLLEWMEDSPYDFLMQMEESDLERFAPFVHRTFNGIDCSYFISRLAEIYRTEGGLEGTLGALVAEHGTASGISRFKELFFASEHVSRSEKHLADPLRGSTAKRINMYLRWMVRKDDKGVDFGLWSSVPMSTLSLPLDVHTGRIARELGLLKRRQNDWKAVQEIDTALRAFDPEDPVKYDFALFGIGVSGEL